MEKIRIKELAEYRGFSDAKKKNFRAKVKMRKPKPKSDGGNYWVTSLSTIANVFKTADIDLIDEKIIDLQNRVRASDRKQTKDQFNRNIEILQAMNEYDIASLKPDVELKFLSRIKGDTILLLEGYPVQAWPDSIFSFSRDGSDEIGAVWFIAGKEAFSETELGMFAEMLYRFLTIRFSEKFFVNPEFCIALDVARHTRVDYSMVESGEIKSVLIDTIQDLKKVA